MPMDGGFVANNPTLFAIADAVNAFGIPRNEIYPRGATPPLVRGVRAITDWLERGQQLGLVGDVGLETAATALLGAISRPTASCSRVPLS